MLHTAKLSRLMARKRHGSVALSLPGTVKPNADLGAIVDTRWSLWLKRCSARRPGELPAPTRTAPCRRTNESEPPGPLGAKRMHGPARRAEPYEIAPTAGAGLAESIVRPACGDCANALASVV